MTKRFRSVAYPMAPQYPRQQSRIPQALVDRVKALDENSVDAHAIAALLEVPLPLVVLIIRGAP